MDEFLLFSGGPVMDDDPGSLLAVGVALHAAADQQQLRIVDPGTVVRSEAAVALDRCRQRPGCRYGPFHMPVRHFHSRNSARPAEYSLPSLDVLPARLLPRSRQTPHLSSRLY